MLISGRACLVLPSPPRHSFAPCLLLVSSWEPFPCLVNVSAISPGQAEPLKGRVCLVTTISRIPKCLVWGHRWNFLLVVLVSAWGAPLGARCHSLWAVSLLLP